MKPTPQSIEYKSRRDSARVVRVRFPRTDCNYQPGTLKNFSGGSEPRASFRGISDNYFKQEARAHFATEAALFAVIFVTAAIPVIEGIRGLIHWVL